MTDMLLNTIIGVSALLLLVLLTRRAVARHFGPRIAYALWLLPILRLVLPPINLPSHWLPDFLTRSEPQTIMVQPAMTEEFVTSVALLNETAPSVSLWDQVLPWIAPAILSFWLVGIVIGLCWLILSQRRQMRRLRNTTTNVSGAIVADIERAASLSGLKTVPQVRQSLHADGPLVCGLRRPLIVIPQDFDARFTPQQRRLALLHEMLHVRRGDLWTATAMMAFRLINWPNPIIHWAWPRFRADQEAACDASVLRCMGETARGDYAETLLTAATTAGRAKPVSGPGLTLSLHHPVKERLMTLGSNTNTKRGVTRWALATLLLAGTAISAPLSLADDPDRTEIETVIVRPDDSKTTTSTKNVMRWVVSDNKNGERKGFEIRETDGVKTYLRVSRDGTTEELTREELVAEYGEDFDKSNTPHTLRLKQIVAGEPGLTALSQGEVHDGKTRTVIVRNKGKDHIEVRVEDGERSIFRVGEDGEKTLITEDELGALSDLNLTVDIDEMSVFPGGIGEGRKVMIVESEDVSNWVGDGENSFAFTMNSGSPLLSDEARLRSAQSMIAATNRMLEDLQDDSDKADRDLRSAEKELERARKALDKAMAAMEKAKDVK